MISDLHEIFRIDRKYWTTEQLDQIDLFFQNHSFFRSFYERQDFNRIIEMTYYAKINPQSSMLLEGSKRSEVILLLSGSVQVSKKRLLKDMSGAERKNRKVMGYDNGSNNGHGNHKHGKTKTKSKSKKLLSNNDSTQKIPAAEYFYEPISIQHQYLSTIYVDADCKVESIPSPYAKKDHQSSSTQKNKNSKSITQNQEKQKQEHYQSPPPPTCTQILFIPSTLYNQHRSLLQKRHIQQIYQNLLKFFKSKGIQRKALQRLAQTQKCSFKNFKIKDYIYKQGSEPKEVYLLFKGIVKMQRTVHSSTSTKAKVAIESDTIVLSENRIFGEKDLLLKGREQNVVVCSAYVKVMAIEKRTFMIFAKQYLNEKIDYIQPSTEGPYNPGSSVQSQLQLPSLKNPERGSGLREFYDGSRVSLIKRSKRIDHMYSLNSSPQGIRTRIKRTDSQKSIQNKLIRNCHMLVNLSPKGSKTARLQKITRNQSNKKNQEEDEFRDYNKDQFKEKYRLFKKIRPNAKQLDLSNRIIDWKVKEYGKPSPKNNIDEEEQRGFHLLKSSRGGKSTKNSLN